MSASLKKLQQELKSMEKEPLDGVVVSLADEADLYKWNIGIFVR